MNDDGGEDLQNQQPFPEPPRQANNGREAGKRIAGEWRAKLTKDGKVSGIDFPEKKPKQKVIGRVRTSVRKNGLLNKNNKPLGKRIKPKILEIVLNQNTGLPEISPKLGKLASKNSFVAGLKDTLEHSGYIFPADAKGCDEAYHRLYKTESILDVKRKWKEARRDAILANASADQKDRWLEFGVTQKLKAGGPQPEQLRQEYATKIQMQKVKRQNVLSNIQARAAKILAKAKVQRKAKPWKPQRTVLTGDPTYQNSRRSMFG